MYTAYVCLGGTGTQLGNAISYLYPLLRLSGIVKEPFTFSMFILDKDTQSAIYEACGQAPDQYLKCRLLLPFDTPQPYKLSADVYQDMQKGAGLLNKENYDVMNLIGGDDDMIKLASMCWTEEKRREKLHEGNNRDPSRGSLDAWVCLEYLPKSSLFKELEKLKGYKDTVRVVILGGITGGMGSSLIVPLVDKLLNSFPKLRIDMVLLGTYFKLPEKDSPPPGHKDYIGSSNDSFYRAADQLEELRNYVVENNWFVYYTAIPGFDDTAGEFFKKNGAREKRKAHLLELIAALAAFEFGEKTESEAGFYQTTLSYGKDRDYIDWTDIPKGNELKKAAEDFLKFVSVVVSGVYPTLVTEKESKAIGKNPYLKQYFQKNSIDKEIIKNMCSELEKWLEQIMPYCKFWQEIQRYTHLGTETHDDDEDKDTYIVRFFKPEDMKKLINFLDFSQHPRVSEILPLFDYEENWMLFLEKIKPDKKRINDVKDAKDKLEWMFKDIWNIIHKEG